jgi:hypothetical protein
MTDTAKMAHAAHVMAEALEVLTPEQRKKAIECALMLCPPEAIEPPKPARARRSDAGMTRKKADAPLLVGQP